MVAEIMVDILKRDFREPLAPADLSRLAHLPAPYSSLLAATGDDVKVVQELMCHAKISITMEIYTQAGMEKKRVARRRAVDV
jgi:hypothetical protein